MHHPEHRIPQKRTQQPPHGSTAQCDQAEHEEGIQTEDVKLLHVEGRENRDAAGSGEDGAEKGGGEVVAAAGFAEGEVSVPG